MTVVRQLGAAGLAVLTAALMTSCSGAGDENAGASATPGAAAANSGSTASAAGPRGIVTGVVRLEGKAPALEPLVVAVNQDVCGAAGRNNRLEVGRDGGIAGAVVYVDIPEAGVSTPVQTMDQVGCVYAPRVIVATPGSTIRFLNSDPTRHNVRIEDPATGRMLLNVAQDQGKADEWKVPGLGAYTVLCDYHPWMNAYVVGVPGRYAAVTAADGSFAIADVPSGSHTVRLWFNGVEMRPKMDNRGQLIGYRFGDPIEQHLTVSVAPDSTTRVELPLRIEAR